MTTKKKVPTLLGKKINVKNILRRISDFVSLPSSGIVAGQAVASAIYEQVGIPVKPVYNDVDVFHVDSRFAFRFMIKDAAVPTVSAWRSSVVCNDYGNVFLSATSRYQIISTSRKGMLNHIYAWSDRDQKISAQDIIGAFDINAVQVGIDLSTEELAFTEAFEQFCKSLELEIVNLYTPASSLARFFIKKEQLKGAYGNEKWAIFNVGNALQMANDNQVCGVVTDFGELTLKKLQSVITKIEPYFEIYRTSCGLDSYQSYHLRLSRRFNEIENGIMPFKFKKDWFLSSCFSGSRCLHYTTPNNIVNINRLFKRPKIFNRLMAFEKAANKSAAELALFRPQLFLQWDGNEKALKRTLKAFRQHPGLLHLAEENSISNQYRIITSLDQLADSRPYRETVYGTAEQMAVRCGEEDWIKQVDLECKRSYDQIVNKKGEMLMGNKVVDGVALRELNEGAMLLERGHEEHHCVASYAEKVEKGESVIIQLDTGKRSESATAELSRIKNSEDGKTAYVIRQIRHSFNDDVKDSLRSRYTEAIKNAFPHPIVEKMPTEHSYDPAIEVPF